MWRTTATRPARYGGARYGHHRYIPRGMVWEQSLMQVSTVASGRWTVDGYWILQPLSGQSRPVDCPVDGLPLSNGKWTGPGGGQWTGPAGGPNSERTGPAGGLDSGQRTGPAGGLDSEWTGPAGGLDSRRTGPAAPVQVRRSLDAGTCNRRRSAYRCRPLHQSPANNGHLACRRSHCRHRWGGRG